MDIELLRQQVETNQRKIDAAVGEARAVLARGNALRDEIKNLTQEIEDLDKAAALLNSMGEQRQAQAQGVIETLVTQGLQTIFDETLSFHIVSSVKGKSPVIDFVIRTTLGGKVIDTPVMDARGGGLAAVVGFLLRLVVLSLQTKDFGHKLLVLDETFAHVSAEYLPGVSQFLRQVVDEFGLQIIMVTHQTELIEDADVVYRFSQTQGKTKAVRVDG